MRKRFIAGAICDFCQKKDRLIIYGEKDVNIIECVDCGHILPAQEAKKVSQRLKIRKL